MKEPIFIHLKKKKTILIELYENSTIIIVSQPSHIAQKIENRCMILNPTVKMHC